MRTPSKGTDHELLTEAVVAKHGAGRVGFSEAIRRLLGAKRGDEEHEHIFEYFRRWRSIPDAFRVDAGSDDAPPVVTAWEVEVSHRLSTEKLSEYVDLLWFLDSELVAFRLIAVSHRGVESEIDLVSWSSGGPMPAWLSERLAFCHAPEMPGVPKTVPLRPPPWLEGE